VQSCDKQLGSEGCTLGCITIDHARLLPEHLILPDPAGYLILQDCSSSEVQSRCTRTVACISSDRNERKRCDQ